MFRTECCISIVVPVYNVEKYLKRCIDSILSQTFKDFELILVDDGSLDNSGIICDEYALRDARIKVVHKANGGLPSARRSGVKKATGEWVGFVDSDDWIEQDMYSVLFEGSKQYADIDVCCGGFTLHKDGEVSFPPQETLPKLYKAQEALLHLLLGTCGKEADTISGSLCKLICKRNLLEHDDVFLDSIVYWEDLYGVWKILQRANMVYYVPYRGYHYCKRSGNLTSQSFHEGKLTYITVPMMIDQWIKKEYNSTTCKFLFDLKCAVAEIIFSHLCKYILVMAREKKYEIEINYFQNFLESYKFQLGRRLTESEKRKYRIVCMPYKTMIAYIDSNMNKAILTIKNMQKVKGKIYIYGAGKIAMEVAELCDNAMIKYEGFVISDDKILRNIFNGKPLISFDELRKNHMDRIGILLAMNEGYMKQVVSNIESSNIHYENIGQYSISY